MIYWTHHVRLNLTPSERRTPTGSIIRHYSVRKDSVTLCWVLSCLVPSNHSCCPSCSENYLLHSVQKDSHLIMIRAHASTCYPWNVDFPGTICAKFHFLWFTVHYFFTRSLFVSHRKQSPQARDKALLKADFREVCDCYMVREVVDYPRCCIDWNKIRSQILVTAFDPIKDSVHANANVLMSIVAIGEAMTQQKNRLGSAYVSLSSSEYIFLF